MFIVKENLVGASVIVVRRYGNTPLWRCVVRAIGIQDGFRLLAEITEVMDSDRSRGVRGELVELSIDDDYQLMPDPPNAPIATPEAA